MLGYLVSRLFIDMSDPAAWSGGERLGRLDLRLSHRRAGVLASIVAFGQKGQSNHARK
jgi:hypothetical protein